VQNLLVGKRALITQSTEFMGPALCKGVRRTRGHRPCLSGSALGARGGGKRGSRGRGLRHPGGQPRLYGAEHTGGGGRRSRVAPGVRRARRPVAKAGSRRGAGDGPQALGKDPRHRQRVCPAWHEESRRPRRPARLRPSDRRRARTAQRAGNAIAQNFVDNPTYSPPEVQENPRFQERLAREVPLGRLVTAREDAQFAAYLCSGAADCFVSQVFPVCGGWVPR
jgi:2-keto-3-deoxy-L-fuconate dehydrogenase